ncbi:zinc finger protein ZOP1 [Salvia divinorum]|uniref:Zinc finger protein ZOP1 n=1 Tax=Salvia divinorum TaxID=28513 RepID=A0ABD1HX32_SALDI
MLSEKPFLLLSPVLGGLVRVTTNKWCDTCKIYISNNPASIRNHELGQRHKDSGVSPRDLILCGKTGRKRIRKKASSKSPGTDRICKWVPQEEAVAAFRASPMSIKKRPSSGKPPSASDSKSGSTSESVPPPGRLVSTSDEIYEMALNPQLPSRENNQMRSSKLCLKRKQLR